MDMNKFAMLALLLIPVSALADEQGVTDLTAHDMVDNRTALGLSPMMNHRLLSNMQAQLAATRTIIGLLAQQKYESASNTARTKLGMTKDLKQVYDSSRNESFKNLGVAANLGKDELVKTLQTKDLNKSLLALRKTMGTCLECHQKFKQ